MKGDGLVTYLKAPSVDLAVQIIDGTPLRDGLQQPLSVSQARCCVCGCLPAMAWQLYSGFKTDCTAGEYHRYPTCTPDLIALVISQRRQLPLHLATSVHS